MVKNIVNMTAETVVICSTLNCRWNNGYWVKHPNPISVFIPNGKYKKLDTIRERVFSGELNFNGIDIPISRYQYIDLSDFSDRKDTMYIVTRQYIDACRELGLSTDRFLLPSGAIRSVITNEIVGWVGFEVF